MSKKPQPAPTANTVGPCPTNIQISRTPRHWKFTQHLRTTQPPHVWLKLLLAGTNFHCPKPGRGTEVLLYFEERHWFWLVGCFRLNGHLRQYFSLYRAVFQREGERGEKRIDESKNVQTIPTRTYYKRSRPLPYCNPNCRTPQHWKFTQHHRTTRPPPERHWSELLHLRRLFRYPDLQIQVSLSYQHIAL